MQPKVLVVGQLPPPVHGSNVMAQRFMEALAANGVAAVMVEKKFSRELDQVGKRSAGKLLALPKICRSLLDRIRRDQPAVCYYFITVGLSALLVDCLLLWLLRRKKVPYVLYFHGMGYRAYEAATYFGVRGVIRYTLKHALGGLVVGERLKPDVNHCIPDDRLYVLPNGIPAVDKSTAATGTAPAEVTLLFLSNLIPAKGPLTFLKVARDLRDRGVAARFILAGRAACADYLARLKQFIAEQRLTQQVVLPGPVYGADKAALLRQADIFVFPTTKDVFGLVNLEAMQWGLPVVSSPVGAIPEIIRDGVNGYIVDPGDRRLLCRRLTTLINDPSLRRQMGAAGRRLYAQHYTPAVYTRNLKAALTFFEPHLLN